MLLTGTEVEDTIYPSADSNDNEVDITTELYSFNPMEGIGSNPSIEHGTVHICAPVTKSTYDKGITKFLECPCLQESRSLDQLRQIVSHLHFVSTRNKGVAGTTERQSRRSTLESSASSRFSCG